MTARCKPETPCRGTKTLSVSSCERISLRSPKCTHLDGDSGQDTPEPHDPTVRGHAVFGVGVVGDDVDLVGSLLDGDVLQVSTCSVEPFPARCEGSTHGCADLEAGSGGNRVRNTVESDLELQVNGSVSQSRRRSPKRGKDRPAKRGSRACRRAQRHTSVLDCTHWQ